MEVQWILVGLLVTYFVATRLKFKRVASQLGEWMKEGAIVLDVRSRGEYEAGHHKGSVNIPLQELPEKLSRLDKTRPVIVCCASGARSARAMALLRAQGFARVENVGPWTNLKGC